MEFSAATLSSASSSESFSNTSIQIKNLTPICKAAKNKKLIRLLHQRIKNNRTANFLGTKIQVYHKLAKRKNFNKRTVCLMNKELYNSMRDLSHHTWMTGIQYGMIRELRRIHGRRVLSDGCLENLEDIPIEILICMIWKQLQLIPVTRNATEESLQQIIRCYTTLIWAASIRKGLQIIQRVQLRKQAREMNEKNHRAKLTGTANLKWRILQQSNKMLSKFLIKSSLKKKIHGYCLFRKKEDSEKNVQNKVQIMNYKTSDQTILSSLMEEESRDDNEREDKTEKVPNKINKVDEKKSQIELVASAKCPLVNSNVQMAGENKIENSKALQEKEHIVNLLTMKLDDKKEDQLFQTLIDRPLTKGEGITHLDFKAEDEIITNKSQQLDKILSESMQELQGSDKLKTQRVRQQFKQQLFPEFEKDLFQIQLLESNLAVKHMLPEDQIFLRNKELQSYLNMTETFSETSSNSKLTSAQTQNEMHDQRAMEGTKSEMSTYKNLSSSNITSERTEKLEAVSEPKITVRKSWIDALKEHQNSDQNNKKIWEHKNKVEKTSSYFINILKHFKNKEGDIEKSDFKKGRNFEVKREVNSRNESQKIDQENCGYQQILEREKKTKEENQRSQYTMKSKTLKHSTTCDIDDEITLDDPSQLIGENTNVISTNLAEELKTMNKLYFSPECDKYSGITFFSDLYRLKMSESKLFNAETEKIRKEMWIKILDKETESLKNLKDQSNLETGEENSVKKNELEKESKSHSIISFIDLFKNLKLNDNLKVYDTKNINEKEIETNYEKKKSFNKLNFKHEDFPIELDGKLPSTAKMNTARTMMEYQRLKEERNNVQNLNFNEKRPRGLKIKRSIDKLNFSPINRNHTKKNVEKELPMRVGEIENREDKNFYNPKIDKDLTVKNKKLGFMPLPNFHSFSANPLEKTKDILQTFRNLQKAEASCKENDSKIHADKKPREKMTKIIFNNNNFDSKSNYNVLTLMLGNRCAQKSINYKRRLKNSHSDSDRTKKKYTKHDNSLSTGFRFQKERKMEELQLKHRRGKKFTEEHAGASDSKQEKVYRFNKLLKSVDDPPKIDNIHQYVQIANRNFEKKEQLQLCYLLCKKRKQLKKHLKFIDMFVLKLVQTKKRQDLSEQVCQNILVKDIDCSSDKSKFISNQSLAASSAPLAISKKFNFVNKSLIGSQYKTKYVRESNIHEQSKESGPPNTNLLLNSQFLKYKQGGNFHSWKTSINGIRESQWLIILVTFAFLMYHSLNMLSVIECGHHTYIKSLRLK